MTTKQKNEMLQDAIFSHENRENEFPTINQHGKINFPICYNGIVRSYEQKETLKGYKGICLEVNDHGNVTLWNCFKNGNRREIASQV
jgi:hypothetical protein